MKRYFGDISTIYLESVVLDPTAKVPDQYKAEAENSKEKVYAHISKEDTDNFYNSEVTVVGGGVYTLKELVNQIKKRVQIVSKYAQLELTGDASNNKLNVANLMRTLEYEGMLYSMVKGLQQILDKHTTKR
jgi:hypothetical protein